MKVFIHSQHTIVLLAAFFNSWLIGCQTTKTAATIKVVGGVEDYTTHSATIGLKLLDKSHQRIIHNNVPATCTGTIVRDDLILTAAHCIRVLPGIGSALVFDKDPSGPLTQRQIESTSYLYFPSATFDTQDPTTIANIDVAFFLFPKGSFAVLPAKIAAQPAAVGDAVRMTGYGVTDISGDIASNPEFKRFSGNNTISQIVPGLAQLIVVESSFVGMTAAVLGEGDSGSSLYNGSDEVIGVASFSRNIKPSAGKPSANNLVSANNRGLTGFTNLADPQIRKFLDAVMQASSPTAATVQGLLPTVLTK